MAFEIMKLTYLLIGILTLFNDCIGRPNAQLNSGEFACVRNLRRTK